MAQPRAVVDVVGAQPGPHEPLEQVGLFVGPLGRSESGQRVASVRISDRGQFPADQLECFLPGRFAEGGHHGIQIDQSAGLVPLAGQRINDLW